MLTFFALYTCKHRLGSSMAVHRITLKIASESTIKNKELQQQSFVETIKLILKMASINFARAVADLGYTNNFYTERQYSTLEQAID